MPGELCAGVGAGGGRGMFSFFFKALGNCKIIDILQWGEFSILLHNTFIIIHSLGSVMFILICWAKKVPLSFFLLKSLIFRRVWGRREEGGILSQATVLSHPISCSFRQRKCIWEGHRISLCLGAARLQYKRLGSTHVSLLGGLSAVTDCQLRLWASSDDCLEMLSA